MLYLALRRVREEASAGENRLKQIRDPGYLGYNPISTFRYSINEREGSYRL